MMGEVRLGVNSDRDFWIKESVDSCYTPSLMVSCASNGSKNTEKLAQGQGSELDAARAIVENMSDEELCEALRQIPGIEVNEKKCPDKKQ